MVHSSNNLVQVYHFYLYPENWQYEQLAWWLCAYEWTTGLSWLALHSGEEEDRHFLFS